MSFLSIIFGLARTTRSHISSMTPSNTDSCLRVPSLKRKYKMDKYADATDKRKSVQWHQLAATRDTTRAATTVSRPYRPVTQRHDQERRQLSRKEQPDYTPTRRYHSIMFIHDSLVTGPSASPLRYIRSSTCPGPSRIHCRMLATPFGEPIPLRYRLHILNQNL